MELIGLDAENAIERHFVNLCKKHNLLQYKFSSPAQRGVPDRMMIHMGKVIFIEFKSTGLIPTEKQLYEHRRIKNAGCDVRVIDSKNGVNLLIEEVLTP